MRDAAIMSQAKEAKQPQDCNDGIRIQNGEPGDLSGRAKIRFRLASRSGYNEAG